MDSRLDTLFRRLPRRTESAGGRPGIRREERQESGRRHDGRDRPDDDAPPPGDSMSVSVATLVLFLESLLGESLAREAGPSPAVEPAGPPGPEALTPGARAAQAYRAAEAQARGGGYAGGVPPSASGAGGTAGMAGTAVLTPEDRRDVGLLLEALRRRQEGGGPEMLDIEWRGGFLDSIRAAMARDGDGQGANE